MPCMCKYDSDNGELASPNCSFFSLCACDAKLGVPFIARLVVSAPRNTSGGPGKAAVIERHLVVRIEANGLVKIFDRLVVLLFGPNACRRPRGHRTR